MLRWVTIEKLAEMSGRSADSLRHKMSEGVLQFGVVWKYSPDRRVILNVEEFDKWQEKNPTVASMRGKHRSSSTSNGTDAGARPSA